MPKQSKSRSVSYVPDTVVTCVKRRTSKDATSDVPAPWRPDLQIDRAIRQDPDDPVIPPPTGPDGALGVHTEAIEYAIFESGRVDEGPAVRDSA